MTPEDETLMRWLDGALSADEAAQVEAKVARDPALAAKAARWKAQAEALRGAFAPTLLEPPPERLLAAAKDSAVVLPFAARLRGRLPRLDAGLAAAAALAVGLGVGLFMRPAEGLIVADAGGALVARGALAQALESQPSGPAAATAAVKILLSTPAADGHCRAFETTAQAGLACSAGDGGPWTIVALTEREPEGQGAYALAGGLPEPILAAIDARRTGEPLDPAAETAAIASGWR